MAKTLRLHRLTTGGGSMVMVALDHGISMGPLAGLEDPARAMVAAAEGGATCITMHRGLVPIAARVLGSERPGLLLHLSAGTDRQPDPNDKRLVATVEEALQLGCDGVSIHVNLGSLTEARQVEDAGRVAAACNDWGMPLVAMVYPRGPGIEAKDPAAVAHAARLAAELGADAVKVPYTSSFRDVVAGCPIPVLVAGGPVRAGMLADLQKAQKAGAQGVSVGRNVFQARDPVAALRRIAKVFP